MIKNWDVFLLKDGSKICSFTITNKNRLQTTTAKQQGAPEIPSTRTQAPHQRFSAKIPYKKSKLVAG